MEDLIKGIVEHIKDYRREDLSMFYRDEINEDHVRKWIEQFNQEDQEFILTEFLHLLPKSYLTKEDTIRIMGNEFETLRKDFGYESVNDFLDETIFLDCQEQGKSQKEFLEIIDEVLKGNYGRSITDCGKKNVRNWLYIDDVLASGGTFKNDILHKIAEFGSKKFKESGIRIIASFVILHNWGTANVKYSLIMQLGYDLGNRLRFYRVAEIDNHPNINYYNPNPQFNHLYPIKSQVGDTFLEFVEKSFDRGYELRNEKFAFRSAGYPKNENFFSSSVNRVRYENILLEKGVDIMHSIEHLTVPGLRPLGMTPPSFKTLGTGSHFFTWRNISNTCPLVFWWGANNWFPLFPVKNRGK